jgi:hypothetical protein
MAEFDLSELQAFMEDVRNRDPWEHKQIRREAYIAMADTLPEDIANEFIKDVDSGLYDDMGAKKMRQLMFQSGGDPDLLKEAWGESIGNQATKAGIKPGFRPSDLEMSQETPRPQQKPVIQFGVAPQQPKPDPADFFNAPGFDKGNVRRESVLNVGGGRPTLPDYLQKPAQAAPTNTTSAAERLDGMLKGGNMEDQAKKLGGFLDDMPKIKRLIEGVPLGLRYGAATLPAAALLTRVALDEADSISDRWSRNRIRAEKRKEALRKLAYSELKDKDSIASLLPQEQKQSPNWYTTGRI